MDKEFWRDNWPLIVFGSIGLLLTTGLLGYATGQPLLPQVDWQALVAPYLPGLIAIGKAGLVTFLAIALCLALVPFRDWLIRKQQLGAEERRRKMLHVPVHHYGSNSNHRPPAMAQIDPRELKHLRQDHQLLYRGIVAICDKHLGGARPATIHGLLNELEFVIAQLQEQSATPAQAAPSGPNWRAIAQLVGWAREERAPRLRASRDAFRAAGVPIPEADVKPGGDFNEWVRQMGSEATPSPTASIVSVVDDSTLTDADTDTDQQENEATDAMPVGEGRSNKVARFIIPRLARKRRGERNDV